MARSIISIEEWEHAKEYFEHGLSLGEIEKRTRITRSAISKKSKSEVWDKESPKKQLLSQAIEVTEGKDTLKDTPVSLKIHDELHDETIRRKNLIYTIQEKAIGKADVMLDNIDTPSDLRTIIEAVHKAGQSIGAIEQFAPRAVTALQINTEEREVKQGIGELYKAING